MDELMKLYEDVFVPSCEGEPPSFEDWKEDYFKEWLDRYVNNMEYEWQARMINNYAHDIPSNIPVCHDLDTLNQYDFTEVYDNIDHDNFNVRHDLWWVDNGLICSGDYCDYVDKYWDNDILDYIIDNIDDFVKFEGIDLEGVLNYGC